MMQYLSLFSGIGAFEKALENLKVKYDLIGYSEIDKYASKSYSAIHGWNESYNLGDITKIDEKSLPKGIDLITYGFPCQDISLAGKQKGFFHEDGTQTRSGLFFDALRIIEETQPKIAIAENVKNLTSKKFKEQFEIVLSSLEEAGYNNYWQILNAKDYGIPQNRERVFIVSIRKDIDTGIFEFPKGFSLEKRLKDLLESEVDEKFYLTDYTINKIQNSNFSQEATRIQGDVYQTLLARDYKDPKCVKVEQKDVKPIRLGGLYDTKTTKHQAGAIWDKNAISPTLMTMQGGNRQPMVMVREATSKGYVEAYEGDSINLEQPNSKTRRGRVGKQVAQTLTTSPQQAVVINPLKDKTQYGWHFEQNVYDSEGITRAIKAGGGSGNIPKVIEEDFMTNERAMDILQNEQLCQEDPVFIAAYGKAIVALKKQSVVEPFIAASRGRNPENASDRTTGATTTQRLEPNSQGLCNTLTTVRKDNYVCEPSVRIRKLTPKECFRLMGFDDEDFYMAEKVNSNTQLYKQAGNSIVVDVIEELFCMVLDEKGNIFV